MRFQPTLFAVSLIDARTGRLHRVGAAGMTLFTRDPETAGQNLLRNRDPQHWKVEVRSFNAAALT